MRYLRRKDQPMKTHLKEAVVVVTGASGGIGRAAATLFAQQGATVVLAARRIELLQEIATECALAGGDSLVIPTDVTQEHQVRALTEQVVTVFGRIDVWVNCAAVLALGRVGDVPVADHEQVIRTNLIGTLYCTRAAVSQFRQQRFGVLINHASVLGAIAAPFASSYCATKWAIRGFTESVRMELLDEPRIHVCTVLPSAIDTSIYRHAANYTGYEAKPPEPVYSPHRVATTIVGLAKRPRREAFVGGFGPVGVLAYNLVPALTERAIAAFITRRQFRTKPAAITHGNIFEPIANEDRDVSDGYGPLWGRVERPLAFTALAAVLLYGIHRMKKR
jgi:short-subunit dehydrogenase